MTFIMIGCCFASQMAVTCPLVVFSKILTKYFIVILSWARSVTTSALKNSVIVRETVEIIPSAFSNVIMSRLIVKCHVPVFKSAKMVVQIVNLPTVTVVSRKRVSTI